MQRIRVAIVADLLEEEWTSMDLVAEMLEGSIRQLGSRFDAEIVRPAMRRRFSRAFQRPGGTGSRKVRVNADRLLNRFVDYPRYLRGVARRYDLFQVVDHSYAHLVHVLPPERTVVICYDLDAFRCLLPDRQRVRNAFYRSIARRTLSGLQKAAAVVVSSRSTGDELVHHRLVPPDRIRVVPLGVDHRAAPDREAVLESRGLPGELPDRPFLLHVGSTIPRKRVEDLIRIFHEVRKHRPDLLLVRVGGAMTPEQVALAESLQVRQFIVDMPFLDRGELTRLYSRAELVLLPSEREGFGFAVVEALAAGASVLASDLPVLREVGGDFAFYRPVGDVPGWSSAVLDLLDGSGPGAPREDQRRTWAGQFTWRRFAERLTDVYASILKR